MDDHFLDFPRFWINFKIYSMEINIMQLASKSFSTFRRLIYSDSLEKATK